MAENDLIWWKRGIVYQIYPRSFQDSNGDGVGDLTGIRERLDYFDWLGVDAVWISPIYPSPMADFGYDVADYCDIDPLFGIAGRFRPAARRGARARPEGHPRLRAEPHVGPASLVRGEPLVARRIRSATGTSGAIRRRTAAPPNNWMSQFRRPRLDVRPTTGQYYYHASCSEQPDLNWRNPDGARGDVRRAALLARPRRRRLPRRCDLAC